MFWHSAVLTLSQPPVAALLPTTSIAPEHAPRPSCASPVPLAAHCPTHAASGPVSCNKEGRVRCPATSDAW